MQQGEKKTHVEYERRENAFHVCGGFGFWVFWIFFLIEFFFAFIPEGFRVFA